MKISLNWIKDFVIVSLDAKKLGELITLRTAEVEGIEDLARSLDHIVVGQIKEINPHPDADKLTVTKTDVGGKTLQIVCGATNIYKGMFAPVALAGAKVKWHGEGELTELKKTKIRGVESNGMLCAGEEIGLENKENGIYDLHDMNVKVGMPLAEVFAKNDVIYEIDNKSLTHRPDLWGHYGMAREVAAITGKKLQKLDPKVTFPSKGDSPKIEIKDKKLCPRYLGVIIKNIKVEESPDWMKSRLIAAGYRPISNIVDITNYVMAELGQPLHAFDKNYINGGIIVRRAEKDEKITTLDGKDRKLDTDMLVIADHKKPVAVAGVMGGENSEINEGTTEIIIESANFNAESVRKTSSKLGLRSESVQRFEKSLDPALAELAIKRVCELVLELNPKAEIAGPLVDQNYADLKEQKVLLDVNTVSSKIGVKLTADKCKKILESLEFGVKKKIKDVLEVTIPTFRATKDIDIEDDLVEEIVRMYGYENIPAQLPDLPIKAPLQNKERKLKHKARELLAYGLGMNEVYNYSFYSENEIKKCLIDEKKHVLLDNYLSQDQTHLRTTLVPHLLKNITDNVRFVPNFQIFEIGRTFVEQGKYFPLEEKWVGGAVAKKEGEKSLYYLAKTITEYFLERFLHEKVEFLKPKVLPPYAHPSRCAEIKVAGKSLGNVFEVHPIVLKNYGIDSKVAMFEINFTQLAQFEEPIVNYSPIPKFPRIDIDVSVVINKEKTVAEIEKAIQKADKTLITHIKLFDIYEGENIEENKKALAFKVYIQSKDRTLTDEEMATIQRRIFTNLQELGGKIRGF